MKKLVETWATVIHNSINNPHFWAITSIILILAFIYYSHIFFLRLTDPRWEYLWHLVIFEFKYNMHGSLLLIPSIYAALIFGFRGILLCYLVSLSIILPRMAYLTHNTGDIIINIAILTLPLLIVIIFTLLNKWKEAETTALAEREEERQAYVKQIIQIQEDERKRIAREIHDDTTQRLWLLSNRVQKIVNNKLRAVMPKTAAELMEFRDKLLRLSEDTRRLSFTLRPGMLDNLGLVSALRWFTEQLSNKDSINAKLLVKGHTCQLNNELNTQLFRIAQETLSNTRRHAEATEVIVTLNFKPNTISMTIKDNGKGFPTKEIRKFPLQGKLGIIGIKERAKLLNGIVNIKSEINKYTSLSVEFEYGNTPTMSQNTSRYQTLNTPISKSS